MNKRLLSGVLLLAVGCSGDDNSAAGGGTGGSAGASGTAGLSGGGVSSNGGAGQGMGGAQGTGATATGAQPGKGGSPAGSGGAPGGGSGGTAGSAAGGASAGGAAGTGTGGMGMAGAPTGDYSVLERNKHANRDGAFVEPKLTAAAAATLVKDAAFNATFTGNMWASPLYLANGPGNKGVFFAVTTGNDVFALDGTTGAQVWKKNIGSSPTANGVSCGNIHPLGILSTPVIDAASRTIYVAGAIGTSSIMRHEVHALSVDDGMEKAGYPITVSGTSGGTTFTPPPQNQRSALSLVNGILYVAYGGHVGDCGDYHGWVFGFDTKDPTKKGGWATLGRGEAIWAAGGLASDGNGVFAVTGNNTARVGDHMMSDGEEVVRVTGLGVLDRSNKNLYFPASWQSMDNTDADFGASNPMYLAVPGSTPDHVVVAISKNGHLYLLDPANLGGMAGHLVDFTIASGAMAIKTAPASFTDAKGVHVLLSTDGGAVCPAGGASGRVVMSVLLAPGSPPTPTVEWCATQAGPVAGPISTTTDGKSDPVVWYMSNGTLKGVNGANGMSVFSSKETCAGVRQWTSPIAVGGRIAVGGDGHLCSWSAP
jgi:hypothetical protein